MENNGPLNVEISVRYHDHHDKQPADQLLFEPKNKFVPLLL